MAGSSNNPPAIPVSFEEAFKLLHEMRVQQVQTDTVLRRSLGEQEKLNAHLVKLAEDHERRLQVLEQFRAVTEATLPEKFANPEEIAAKLDELNARQERIETRSANQDKSIAVLSVKIGALCAVAIMIIQSVLQPLIKAVAAFFSGGSHP